MAQDSLAALVGWDVAAGLLVAAQAEEAVLAVGLAAIPAEAEMAVDMAEVAPG